MSVTIPPDFLDPITFEIFVEPVEVSCCHKSFERSALNRWLDVSQSSLCPHCRQKIGTVIKNKVLIERIKKEFIKISKINAKYFKDVKKSISPTKSSTKYKFSFPLLIAIQPPFCPFLFMKPLFSIHKDN